MDGLKLLVRLFWFLLAKCHTKVSPGLLRGGGADILQRVYRNDPTYSNTAYEGDAFLETTSGI